MKTFNFFKAFLVFVALTCSTSLKAADNEWTVTPSPLTIEKGGTVELVFNLNMTTSDIRYYSFKFALPEGVSLADFDESGNKAFSAATDERITVCDRMEGYSDKLKMSYLSAADVYKVQVSLGSGNALGGTTGKSLPVFSVKIAAAADATVGSSVITISELQVLDEANTEVSSTFENPSLSITEAVEKVTVSLIKQYNTYVPAKDLDFTGLDIKAYYVTAVTATEATITKATTVAAGEGIIISGTPGDYEVPVATAEVAPSEENLLKTEGIAANDYILYNGKFVLCSDGELADGKAYLPASAFTAGAKIINIVFGGESTGINEVQKSEADGAIYNLSGMRVSKTQKGVYIMNGRKVIVK